MFLNKSEVRKLMTSSLREDIGRGDITSQSVVPAKLIGKARLTLKEDAVVCGLNLLNYFFPKSQFRRKSFCNEGDFLHKNSIVLKIEGNYRKLLERERVFLNFLGHLSGIATLTHHFVQACKNKKIKILETRKTTPLLRSLEKYAVCVGGGTNHRFDLNDAILIKENHINAVKSVYHAVRLAQQKNPHKIIEVEVKNLSEVREALVAQANIILLDNMSMTQIKRALSLRAQPGNRKAKIEVSGGVTLKNIKKLTKLKIDRISIGALTHSAKSIDYSLWIEK